MSGLSDALVAMEKATEPLRGEEQYRARKVVEKAAPDALAWIKEALPVVISRAQEVRQALDPIVGSLKYNDPELRAEDEAYLARLDALIARAKPEEVLV